MTSSEGLAARAACYAPSPGVRTLRLGGRRLLYSQHHQQVLELNETAERIWQALAAAGSVSAAAETFADLGLSQADAADLIGDAALQWTEAGFVAPLALDELLADRRPPDRTLALDELVVELRLGGVQAQALDAVFGHLYAAAARPGVRLTILEHAGRLLFYIDRRLALVGAAESLAAHLKAILTDLYVDAVEGAYLTHGAMLLRGGCALLLSGEPGAGKTTLALALAAAGWRYGSDDIVRISPEGAARGVAFAAAVKRGSLPLLRPLWPGLDQLPEWLRTDGQQARYLLPPRRAQTPQRLNLVVTLARRSGARAEFQPISAVEALNAIMQGGYARRWSMTADAFCALAVSLERAVCVRLEYSDLEPAVAAIGDIASAHAEAA